MPFFVADIVIIVFYPGEGGVLTYEPFPVYSPFRNSFTQLYFGINELKFEFLCGNQHHILYTLSQILAEAEYQEIILDNPCRKIEKFADNHKKKIPISHENLFKLFPLEEDEFKKVWPRSYWGTMFL